MQGAITICPQCGKTDSIKMRRCEFCGYNKQLSTFNKISWVVCTFGLGLLLATVFQQVVGQPDEVRLNIITGTLILGVMIGVYLLFPYYVYHRQVVELGEKIKGGWGCLYMLYTGILPGFLMLALFDMTRFLLKLIIRPEYGQYIQFICKPSKQTIRS